MGILQNLTGWHAIVILAIVLLLFGAAKLPLLAKSIGQSAKIFKTEIAGPDASAAPTTPTDTSTAAAGTTTVSDASPVVTVSTTTPGR